MAKNKGVRIVITLECTECRSNPAKRSPGVSRYTTEKNRRNTTERLEIQEVLSPLQQDDSPQGDQVILQFRFSSNRS